MCYECEGRCLFIVRKISDETPESVCVSILWG